MISRRNFLAAGGRLVLFAAALGLDGCTGMKKEAPQLPSHEYALLVVSHFDGDTTSYIDITAEDLASLPLLSQALQELATTKEVKLQRSIEAVQSEIQFLQKRSQSKYGSPVGYGGVIRYSGAFYFVLWASN